MKQVLFLVCCTALVTLTGCTTTAQITTGAVPSQLVVADNAPTDPPQESAIRTTIHSRECLQNLFNADWEYEFGSFSFMRSPSAVRTYALPEVAILEEITSTADFIALVTGVLALEDDTFEVQHYVLDRTQEDVLQLRVKDLATVGSDSVITHMLLRTQDSRSIVTVHRFMGTDNYIKSLTRELPQLSEILANCK